MFNVIEETITLPDGREIHLESGKLARQADGSIVLTMGKAKILATAVANSEAREGVDFLPMSVDYQERFAAAGRIPGGFLRREGRLSEDEILTSRLVDRAIRPLFPSTYHAETQLNLMLISSDSEVAPDALACLAASAALAVSDIPVEEHVSEVRVIKLGGEFIVNPKPADIKEADLDLIIAATYDNIMMVEGEMKEAQEEDLIEALKTAHEVIKTQCEAQKSLALKAGKTEKRNADHETHDEALRERIFGELYPKAYAVAQKQINNKSIRKESFDNIKKEFVDSLPEDHELDLGLVSKYFGDVKKKACRDLVLQERVRIDGRQLNEIRQIVTEVNVLPAAHGSSLFTRGETQSLTTLTLGTKLDEQMVDNATEKFFKKYLLHYNFPGFSTGEVKPNRGPARREIGHGNLAMRGLRFVLPEEETFAYTVRIVSDILESNGSSSMATVCAGSLALMDAGVPISAPVSGIAMGLIMDEETGNYAILSDILGDEDHLGDMDFKVTGTSEGITACQMDIKVNGLPYEVMAEALHQAKEGRLHILGKMAESLEAPRPDYKPHAPRNYSFTIARDMIGALIGPGGKIIQEIQRTTNSTIVVEEKDDMGHVSIFANNQEDMDAAVAAAKGYTASPEINTLYTGKITSIREFGAFVEFLPGREGLLHISEVAWERLENLDGILAEGDEVEVKLLEINEGKFRLSRKVLLPKPEGYVERERRGGPRGGGDRGPRRGGDRGGRGGDRRGGDRDRGPRRRS